MQTKTDAQLLREYATGSETAFGELVSRHTDLVYSAALRQVIDPDFAWDVSQSVFTDLGRKAKSLSGNIVLAGWLYRSTRFAALTFLRNERRRQNRERQAVQLLDPPGESSPDWDRIRPVLDEAMANLGDADRDALVLRFFNKEDFRAVGVALGHQRRCRAKARHARSGETPRVSSSPRRDVVVGSAGHRPDRKRGAGGSGGIGGHNLRRSCRRRRRGSGRFNLQRPESYEHDEIESGNPRRRCRCRRRHFGGGSAADRLSAPGRERGLRMQSTQLEQFRTENQQFAGGRANADELERLRNEVAELHRLRAGVARLRQERTDAAQLQAENARLKQNVANRAGAEDDKTASTPEQEQFKRQAIDRLNFATQWLLSFIIYAENHEGRLPQKFSDVDVFDVLAGSIEGLSPSDFEIVYDGKLPDIKDTSRTIILREKEARINPDGNWTKAYGFADGHSEIHRPPDGNFERFEKERIVASPAH